MSDDENNAADALHTIVRLLYQLDEGERHRVLKAVETFFQAHSPNGDPANRDEKHSADQARTLGQQAQGRPNFSSSITLSPKDFLAQKQPRTDVERIACLAYYLTHFREMPYFKNLDLAKLNTEAAHPKFSNAAYASNNATNAGYLAPAPNGQRQISAAGEQFVQALPDREAAKEAMSKARRRNAARKKK
ncbi:MAG: hypothetical protein WC701_13965 [Kiritimatiellales bacterium]|jgi:hypothetical protein